MNANVGDMDTLVTVKSCTIGKDARGGKTYTFTEHSKVWAKVTRRVDENIMNQNLEASQDLGLIIYKIEGLTTRWQVVVEGKPYSIVSVDPMERSSRLCELSLRAIDG